MSLFDKWPKRVLVTKEVPTVASPLDQNKLDATQHGSVATMFAESGGGRITTQVYSLCKPSVFRSDVFYSATMSFVNYYKKENPEASVDIFEYDEFNEGIDKNTLFTVRVTRNKETSSFHTVLFSSSTMENAMISFLKWAPEHALGGTNTIELCADSLLQIVYTKIPTGNENVTSEVKVWIKWASALYKSMPDEVSMKISLTPTGVSLFYSTENTATTTQSCALVVISRIFGSPLGWTPSHYDPVFDRVTTPCAKTGRSITFRSSINRGFSTPWQAYTAFETGRANVTEFQGEFEISSGEEQPFDFVPSRGSCDDASISKKLSELLISEQTNVPFSLEDDQRKNEIPRLTSFMRNDLTRVSDYIVYDALSALELVPIRVIATPFEKSMVEDSDLSDQDSDELTEDESPLSKDENDMLVTKIRELAKKGFTIDMLLEGESFRLPTTPPTKSKTTFGSPDESLKYETEYFILYNGYSLEDFSAFIKEHNKLAQNHEQHLLNAAMRAHYQQIYPGPLSDINEHYSTTMQQNLSLSLDEKDLTRKLGYTVTEENIDEARERFVLRLKTQNVVPGRELIEQCHTCASAQPSLTPTPGVGFLSELKGEQTELYENFQVIYQNHETLLHEARTYQACALFSKGLVQCIRASSHFHSDQLYFRTLLEHYNPPSQPQRLSVSDNTSKIFETAVEANSYFRSVGSESDQKLHLLSIPDLPEGLNEAQSKNYTALFETITETIFHLQTNPSNKTADQLIALTLAKIVEYEKGAVSIFNHVHASAPGYTSQEALDTMTLLLREIDALEKQILEHKIETALFEKQVHEQQKKSKRKDAFGEPSARVPMSKNQKRSNWLKWRRKEAPSSDDDESCSSEENCARMDLQ